MVSPSVPPPGSASPSAAFDFQLSDDGVMVIRWNRTATPEESRSLMDLIRREWVLGRPYACAMITHRDVNADARHRKLWSDWHLENRPRIERLCRGAVMTLDSPGIRALMTVLGWFSPTGYPVKYVATEEEAVRWARALMARK